MKHAYNDNNSLSFIALAALTANVIRFLELQKEQREECDRETDRRRADEEKAEDQRKYVEQRLRESAIWERRLRGK